MAMMRITDRVLKFDTGGVTAPATIALNGAIDGSQTNLTFNAAYGAPNGTVFTIDGEAFFVVSGSGTVNVTVAPRPWGGGVSASHSNGATVHVPGALVQDLIDFAAVPNRSFIFQKISSDIHYVKLVPQGTDQLPDNEAFHILADNSAAYGSYGLMVPAGPAPIRAIRTIGGVGAAGASGASSDPVQITFSGALGTVGSAFTGSLAASGGTSPYTYAIASGSLPAGLALNTSTGAITGTPTTPGTYSFQGQATDSVSHTAAVNCTIMIAATPGPLQISFSGSNLAYGFPANSALFATGGTQPYTFALSAGSLPTGLSLNTATGAITGTPLAAGAYTFTGQVTDNVGAVKTISCAMYVTYFDVPGAVVSAVSASEAPNSVYQDTNGGLHMAIAITASLTSSLYPVRTRIWLDYDDGNGWTLQGDQWADSSSAAWTLGAAQQQTGVTIPGTIWVPTDPAKVNWKVAAEANSHDQQPSGSAVTANFTVTPAQAAGATDLTGLQFVNNPATGDPFVYARDVTGTYYWIPYEIDYYQPNLNPLGDVGDTIDVDFKSSFLTVQLGYEASGACTITGGTAGSAVSGVTLTSGDVGAEVHVGGQLSTIATVNVGAQTFTLSTAVTNGAGLTLAIWRPAPVDATNGTQGQSDPNAALQGYVGRRFTDGPPASILGMTQVRWQGNPQWSIQPATNLDGTANLYRTFRLRAYAVSRLADNEHGGSQAITLETTWPANSDGSTDHGDLVPSVQQAAMDLSQVNATTSFSAAAPFTGGGGTPVDIAVAGALAKVAKQIVVANKGITNAYIDDVAVQARNMATAAITYANAAIDANAIVDSNVATMKLSKVIADTVVFSGNIAMARGNGQAVLTMDNTGMFLFSNCTASGSGVTPGTPGSPTYTASGLTSSPYVAIQAAQIGVFSGGSGPSVTVAGGGINLWSVNGSTGFPYANLTSTAWALHSGNFLFQVTASQLQFSYSGGPSATLNSVQFQMVSGSYSTTISSTSVKLAQSASVSLLLQSGAMTLYSVDGNTGFPYCTLDATNGFKAINGSYSTTVNSSGVKTLYAGGPSAVLTSGGLTQYSVDGNTGFPYTSLSTSGLVYTASSFVVTLGAGFLKVANSTAVFAEISNVAFQLANGGNSVASLAADAFNHGYLQLYNGNTGATEVLLGSGVLQFNGTQVITVRQAGPGNTTDITDVAARFNVLLGALRTHGLIT